MKKLLLAALLFFCCQECHAAEVNNFSTLDGTAWAITPGYHIGFYLGKVWLCNGNICAAAKKSNYTENAFIGTDCTLTDCGGVSGNVLPRIGIGTCRVYDKDGTIVKGLIIKTSNHFSVTQ